MSEKWRTRLAYFCLGVLVTWGAFLLSLHWLDLARLAMGRPHMGADAQPAALRLAQQATAYLAWFVGAGVLVACVATSRWSRLAAYALGAVLVYGGLILSLLARPIFDQVRNQVAFDPVRWRANASARGFWPDRLRMVDDLLASRDLRGMPRDSLEYLLGPRDSTAYWRTWDLVYWLGPKRGLFGLDSEWLVIRLDSTDRCGRCAVGSYSTGLRLSSDV